MTQTIQRAPGAPSAKAGGDPAVISQLKAMGFSDSEQFEPRRLVMSLEGREKTGKSHFANTATQPIFLFNIDRGTEGVLGKFQRAGRQIYVYTVRVPKGLKQAVYEGMWRDVKERLEKVCRVGEGTLIMDTSSEIYELVRLAHFGKLEQVMPHHYSEVNAEWRKDILGWIYDSTMNAILIHKVKPKYINNVRTNEYEVSGFGETGYLVQCNATAYRELGPDGDTRFSLSIDDCRQNASIIGTQLHGSAIDASAGLFIDPMVNFEFLMGLVHG